MNFFEKFAAGSIGFTEIGQEFARVWNELTGEGGAINKYWTIGMDWLNSVLPFAWIIPAVLIFLSLLQIFFGKKLLGLEKFLVCLTVGFGCGVAYIYPLLAGIGITFIPDWVVGLIVAIVAAILSKLIYLLAYIVAAGCAGYILCMSGILPDPIGTTIKIWYVGVGVAVVFVILALLLKKYIEMLGTAALGGFTLYLSFVALIATFDWMIAPEYNTWWLVCTICISAFIGFIVQFKSRRRD